MKSLSKLVTTTAICVVMTACGGSGSSSTMIEAGTDTLSTKSTTSLPEVNASKPLLPGGEVETTMNLIIEENEPGFCGFDAGSIDSEHIGFLGAGYVNTVNTVGASTHWGVRVKEAGMYDLVVRFANGNVYDRDARFYVNNIAHEYLPLPSTGRWPEDWRSYRNSVAIPTYLNAGFNKITLAAVRPAGLPNIDHLSITGVSQAEGVCFDPEEALTPIKKIENESTESDLQTLIIEEKQPGFCGFGKGSRFATEYDGFSGEGYVETPQKRSANLRWRVKAQHAGSYSVVVRFANGDIASRDGWLIVNGKKHLLELPPTGFTVDYWNNYVYSAAIQVDLKAGKNSLKLKAKTRSGLPIIDNIAITGEELVKGLCKNKYRPRPTLIPSPEPTPTPVATPTPIATPVATPIATPEATPTPTQQPSPQPTPEPMPQPSVEPEPTPEPTQEPEPTAISAIIGWDIPSSRQNGEDLLLSEIGGYEVRYKNSTDANYKTVVVEGGSNNSLLIEGIPPGEYEVLIAAFDTDGIYSEFSEATSATIGN